MSGSDYDTLHLKQGCMQDMSESDCDTLHLEQACMYEDMPGSDCVAWHHYTRALQRLLPGVNLKHAEPQHSATDCCQRCRSYKCLHTPGFLSLTARRQTSCSIHAAQEKHVRLQRAHVLACATTRHRNACTHLPEVSAFG